LTTASGNLFPEAVAVLAAGVDHPAMVRLVFAGGGSINKTKALVPMGTMAFCKRFLCRNY
jgi:hypothetical protein